MTKKIISITYQEARQILLNKHIVLAAYEYEIRGKDRFVELEIKYDDGRWETYLSTMRHHKTDRDAVDAFVRFGRMVRRCEKVWGKP